MTNENPPLVPAAYLQAHVLIVEEDEAVSALVETALQRCGMTTVLAKTVGHALILSETGSCDAMVVDSTMLPSDGPSQLRRLSGGPTPIVVLLGSTPRNGQADRLNDVVLAIPFAEQDLLDALAAAFGHFGSLAPALVDHDVLTTLWHDDAAALFREVSAVFLQEIERRCVTIVGALGRLDRVTLKYQAHTLKGAAANVCATRLERAASWLETAAAIASAAMVDRAATHLCSVARLTAAAMEPVVWKGP